MIRRAAQGMGRFGRTVCGLWPDRNPLRRSWDRIEAGITAALITAFLAGALLAAFAAGHWAYRSGLRAVHTQQASSRQVPAILLSQAAKSGSGGCHGATVLASWTEPSGTRRTGKIPAPPGARAGTQVLVWVDAAGRLASPPLQRSQVAGRATLIVVFAPVVVGLVLVAV